MFDAANGWFEDTGTGGAGKYIHKTDSVTDYTITVAGTVDTNAVVIA